MRDDLEHAGDIARRKGPSLPSAFGDAFGHESVLTEGRDGDVLHETGQIDQAVQDAQCAVFGKRLGLSRACQHGRKGHAGASGGLGIGDAVADIQRRVDRHFEAIDGDRQARPTMMGTYEN